MSTMLHDDPKVALAAQRARQATLAAGHREARLQAARRYEDDLFAEADRLALTIGGFLRRLRKTDAADDRPAPLQRAEHRAPAAQAERDAA